MKSQEIQDLFESCVKALLAGNAMPRAPSYEANVIIDGIQSIKENYHPSAWLTQVEALAYDHDLDESRLLKIFETSVRPGIEPHLFRKHLTGSRP